MTKIKMLTNIQMESSDRGIYTIVKKGDIAEITKNDTKKTKYSFYCKSENGEFFTANEEEFKRIENAN